MARYALKAEVSFKKLQVFGDTLCGCCDHLGRKERLDDCGSCKDASEWSPRGDEGAVFGSAQAARFSLELLKDQSVSEELASCLEAMVKKVTSTAVNGLYEVEPEEGFRTIMVTYANHFGRYEYWLKVKDIPTKKELNDLLGFFAPPRNIRDIHIDCIENNPNTATLIRKDGRLTKNDGSPIQEVSYEDFRLGGGW